MPKYPPSAHPLASLRIRKALSSLAVAGGHITRAIQLSPDKHHADGLRSLVCVLQELRNPLSEIAGQLESRRDQ